MLDGDAAGAVKAAPLDCIPDTSRYKSLSAAAEFFEDTIVYAHHASPRLRKEERDVMDKEAEFVGIRNVPQ
jgi:hypothetical protein